MATIKEIAEHAGVSIGTASNVVNGRTSVREATRKRVLKAIEELKYQPSLLGRALRKDKINMIVMIVPDITNPFFPALVRGAEDVAFQADYRLVLCNSDNDSRKESAYMHELRAYRPSGVILVPADLSKGIHEAEAYQKMGANVVYMDRIPSAWRGDAVTSDHEAGAYAAAKYLVGLGHKRIAIITGPLKGTSAAVRLRGFERAMKEAKLSVPAEYIQEATFDKIAGHEKAAALLRLKRRPTAIFASNDLIAFGALTAIREAGLTCPRDISVIGFDNLDLGDTSTPSLSTIDQFAYNLGARAAQIILDRLQSKQEQSAPKRLLMPTELRIRQSTAAPPKS